MAWNLLDLRLEIAVLVGAPLVAVKDDPSILLLQNVLLHVVIGRESYRKVQALLLVENVIRREVIVLFRSYDGDILIVLPHPDFEVCVKADHN